MKEVVDILGRMFREWWDSLLLPPKPSEFFVLFLEDVMNTKKAVIAIPSLRVDESAYRPVISSRELIFSIDFAPEVNIPIQLSQSSYEIPGIQDGHTLSVSIVNVCSDGRKSARATRESTAPNPNPVPAPDAPSITWEDEV